MNQTIITHNLGFPPIGANRELEKAREAYWRGDSSQADLKAVGCQLRLAHWQLQADAGLNLIPTGDFAWYDQVLTLSATFGNIPLRHRKNHILANKDQYGEHGGYCATYSENHSSVNTTACTDIDVETLFRVARGNASGGGAISASEIARWFDTSHHYLVPEFHPNQEFKLSWTQIIDETTEAIAKGYAVKPVILGPLSYLWLGKEKTESENQNFDRFDLLENLLPAYQQLLQALADAGAQWVQIDEPILVLDLPAKWQQAFERAYHTLKHPQLKILAATYFGSLGENLSTAINLPVAGLHIDAVRAPEQILTVIDRLSAHKILSIGVIDGRSIWRNDLQKSLNLLHTAQMRLGDRLWIAPSCSLLHSPVDVNRKEKLDADIKKWLAFAKQKVQEIVTLKNLLTNPADTFAQQSLTLSNKAVLARGKSSEIHTQVQAQLQTIMSEHSQPY
jgi:5-methyltetrahydropteroyltriglutamate--homocysteine methyltransferase